VLQQAEEERSRVAKIKERQKTWVGHLLRREFITKIHRRKNTRKTNKRKKKN